MFPLMDSNNILSLKNHIFIYLSVSYQPFTALGSGTLPAISVLETKFKDDLTVIFSFYF